ncbi:Phosphoethanolamine/phosphocholine phosphatase [Angomonas deanei]|uniref:Phosphatase, putative n=1 Tax=Angomonas deanei TaxID=59799 RepID=A0A7G2CMC7_9TRYP|nr:Phosphoethanolamine/phosphocholine phosphatase [Angomonas deanei]CAD2220061.1 Putative Phosphatase, putative [Angomonas deanei]|eukprot:EPY21929.1 Phosphoethanolamine/phosphocholine phosphatase [Angomonas deanei]
MKAIGRQSFLIVFDFDHTVVNCNTDEVIPRALSPPLTAVQHTMKNKLGMQWTKIMDCLCSTYTKEEMTAAAKESIELDPDMPAVFEYLLEAKYRYPVKEDAIPTGTSDQKAQHRVPGFLEINIASDANTMFIDASLDAVLPFLKNHVSQIHSNPYYELKEAGAEAGREVCYGGDNTHNTNADDEKERDALFKELYEATAAKAGEKEKLITDFTRKSRVCWYEPKGHDCPCCLHRGKPNMCKTKIIQRIMNTTALLDYTIIFVGDGANDYCPILNLLRPRDYMFARRDFPIHEILSTPIDEKGGNIVGGCCQIGLWKDAKELLQLFQTAIDHPTQGRLPTLSRFRDLNLHNSGLEEFRAVTLKKRCGDAIHRTVKALSGQQQWRPAVRGGPEGD